MESIGIIVLRLILFFTILFLLYLLQRFWFLKVWRLAGRVRRPGWRRLLRVVWSLVLLAVFTPVFAWMVGLRLRILPRGSSAMALAGLWLSSAFLAYLAVKVVKAVEWLWSRWAGRRSEAGLGPATEWLESPSRRYFFQSAAYLAGAVPFVGALYGFAAERLRYRIERVEVPIPNLPAALDGLRIAQLSDIHIGGYMPREQVRRAVDMANEFSAELAVVTGDFVTGASDPLEACVEELARLRAPLGVWGCNGNHEIYAGVEDYAEELFRQAGVRLLRGKNAEVVWRGQPFNLIGVDYQRERTPSGRRLPMLPHVAPLVRRDLPNILLSHNPNVFPRAAALGIELALAGHTHGGQVQVEILHQRFSPARFFTEFVAGLYQRPAGAPSNSGRGSSGDTSSTDAGPRSPATSFLYVNRGLGTIAAPVRINAPPEITLLILRRAV